ncbi:MAG TPA: SPOR domain-containing protein [Terracidiphilus sp.]|nr:SPOR domain-containing protein [Terracidiphilus sp.]
MLRSFGKDEFDEEEERHETEFTLGPAMLLALGLGLILLCGLFFGIGYSVGHRNSAPAVSVSQTASGQTVMASTSGTLSKPPAAGTIPAAPVVTDPPQQALTNETSAPNPLTSYAPLGGNSTAPTGQQQVKPAMPQQETAATAANAPTANRVQPAIPQGPPVMVQVAAVSHQEDASVLVAALRKHGYAAMAKRGIADGMIHVQVGPFANRNEASAMCQRLLGDGYNANIVQ